MDEFTLIDKLFKSSILGRQDVLLGIGDDAACLRVPEGMDLLVSTDTLVSGIHFLPSWDAYDIACKAVMANVSDMAAMASEPAWVTLALTLPTLDSVWLGRFASGLKDSLESLGIALVGGDTTRGPLSITITVMGFSPLGLAVKRSGAKPGDVVMVSGSLGAAALAVQLLEKEGVLKKDRDILMKALLHPKPRVDLIPFLREYASSAIDISDGLSADLNHLCAASGVGACLRQEEIPMHPLLAVYAPSEALHLALTGGDDYELCFTVAADSVEPLQAAFKQAGVTCYVIGCIEKELGLRLQGINKVSKPLMPGGYMHFKEGDDEV